MEDDILVRELIEKMKELFWGGYLHKLQHSWLQGSAQSFYLHIWIESYQQYETFLCCFPLCPRFLPSLRQFSWGKEMVLSPATVYNPLGRGHFCLFGIIQSLFREPQMNCGIFRNCVSSLVLLRTYKNQLTFWSHHEPQTSSVQSL